MFDDKSRNTQGTNETREEGDNLGNQNLKFKSFGEKEIKEVDEDRNDLASIESRDKAIEITPGK